MKYIHIHPQPFSRRQVGTYLECPVRLGLIGGDTYVRVPRICHIQMHTHVCCHIRHHLVLRDGAEDLRVISAGLVAFGCVAIYRSP